MAKNNPFAGMPLRMREANLANLIILLHKHRSYPLERKDFRDLSHFADSQRQQFLEVCLIEEAIRLLQDLCCEEGYSEQAEPVVLFKLPERQLHADWLSAFHHLVEQLRTWTGYVSLCRVELYDPKSGDLVLETCCTSLKRWSPEFEFSYDSGDPSSVITDLLTGGKFVLLGDPGWDRCVPSIVSRFLHSNGEQLPAPDTESQSPTLSGAADIVGVVHPNFSVDSSNYRQLTFRGEKQHPTPDQASVVKLLDEARRSGIGELAIQSILDTIGRPTSRLRDIFRGSPLWGTLIIRGSRKDLVKLDI